MEQHHNECDFMPIKCKNQGCNKELKRCEEEDHLKTCPFQKIQCRMCNLMHLRKEAKRHEEVCPEAFITCEKCDIAVKRKDMKAHDCMKALKEQNKILIQEK